jgi:hypothetical protein
MKVKTSLGLALAMGIPFTLLLRRFSFTYKNESGRVLFYSFTCRNPELPRRTGSTFAALWLNSVLSSGLW